MLAQLPRPRPNPWLYSAFARGNLNVIDSTGTLPSSAAPARSDEFLGHPKGVYVCFFTEMWERFSFYGMKALLLLYLIEHHKFGDRIGLDVLGAYGGLVYCIPVGGRHLILRTAWVYAARGQNFLRTALRLAGERDELRIVNDQIGSPTPARWLAAVTALALAKHADAEGTWHVVADGECSWHEFAMAIYGEALVAGVLAKSPKLIGVPSSEYPTKAKRPAYSRLDTGKFARDFGLRLPPWRHGLAEVMAEIAQPR